MLHNLVQEKHFCIRPRHQGAALSRLPRHSGPVTRWHHPLDIVTASQIEKGLSHCAGVRCAAEVYLRCESCAYLHVCSV